MSLQWYSSEIHLILLSFYFGQAFHDTSMGVQLLEYRGGGEVRRQRKIDTTVVYNNLFTL